MVRKVIKAGVQKIGRGLRSGKAKIDAAKDLKAAKAKTTRAKKPKTVKRSEPKSKGNRHNFRTRRFSCKENFTNRLKKSYCSWTRRISCSNWNFKQKETSST